LRLLQCLELLFGQIGVVATPLEVDDDSSMPKYLLLAQGDPAV